MTIYSLFPVAYSLTLAMGAVVGVDAGEREAEAFYGLAADEVLLDDLFGVAGVGEAVPDGLGVDDHNGGVLALVEAAGLVDADLMLEASGLDGVFESAFELFAVFVRAAGAGGGLVALVHADEDVVFKVGHGKLDAHSSVKAVKMQTRRALRTPRRAKEDRK
jgi:hypothetical protein